MGTCIEHPYSDDPKPKSVGVTFAASNTTESKTLFTFTGTIEVVALYGVVTTALGSNHTAAHFRLNDGTNTPAITLATGTTMSNAAVGSTIVADRLAATAVTLGDSSQARVLQPSTVNGNEGQNQIFVAKNGATNTIEYRYTTTSTPTSGAATFFIKWRPLSPDASVS